MSVTDPRYSEVNARTYPPITRAQAGSIARQLIAKLGAPSLAAVAGVCDDDGSPMFPARRVLTQIFERYCPPHRRNLGRTCWASTKPTMGHDKGWGRLIHDVSHMLQEYRHPSERPHSNTHALIEREVAACVDRNGMIERCAPKPRPDANARRIALIQHKRELLAKWDAKLRRASNAKRKLLRQISALKRAAGDMTL